MDPIIASIVTVLAKYAVDKGVALAREVGAKAAEKAKELFSKALDHLRKNPTGAVIAGEFEKAPEAYQKPVEKALDEAAQADPAFLARLKALFEQYQREATVYQATLTSSGAIAQGRSVAAGERGVAIGGSAQGNVIVTGDHAVVGSGNQVGGIRAGRIDAENVVEGAQMIGGDAQAAAGLVDLAKAIHRGGITADEIKAKNLVSGLQYIADPTQATPDDLRREIAALRERVEKAIAAGEIADAGDADDARDAIQKAEAEASSPQPQGSRVSRKLSEVTDILIRVADAAKAAGKVGMEVIKLAPIAATLKQIAERLFGG